MSCHWYNEGIDKVVIGIWCLQWSPQTIFESWVGTNLAWPIPTFHLKEEGDPHNHVIVSCSIALMPANTAEFEF